MQVIECSLGNTSVGLKSSMAIAKRLRVRSFYAMAITEWVLARLLRRRLGYGCTLLRAYVSVYARSRNLLWDGDVIDYLLMTERREQTVERISTKSLT